MDQLDTVALSPLGGAWTWKTEPVSPLSIYEDTWLFDSTEPSTADELTAFDLPLGGATYVVKHEGGIDVEFISTSTSSSVVSTEENKAEVYTKILDDLDHFGSLDEIIKNEHFSNWFEEKSLPIFEDIRIEPVRGYALPEPPPPARYKTEDLKPLVHHVQHVQVPSGGGGQHHQHVTSDLLQEFETVYGALEISHGQLTPPQSPPLALGGGQRHLTALLTPVPAAATHQPSAATLYHYHPHQQQQQQLGGRALSSDHLSSAPGTPQPDVAHELAVVDELVRSRAENMFPTWEMLPSSVPSPTSTSTSSGHMSSVSSSATNSGANSPTPHGLMSPSSPSSSSSSGFSEYSSDPEWIPEPVVHSGEGDREQQLVDRPSRGRKRAGKPYTRVGPEDKKSRKKEQNKNAATRYRQKKKAEVEVILTEEKLLQDHKDGLRADVLDLQREIKCLKGLMRDLFRAKGLIQ